MRTMAARPLIVTSGRTTTCVGAQFWLDNAPVVVRRAATLELMGPAVCRRCLVSARCRSAMDPIAERSD